MKQKDFLEKENMMRKEATARDSNISGGDSTTAPNTNMNTTVKRQIPPSTLQIMGNPQNYFSGRLNEEDYMFLSSDAEEDLDDKDEGGIGGDSNEDSEDNMF